MLNKIYTIYNITIWIFNRADGNLDYEIIIVQGMELITHMVKNPQLTPTSRGNSNFFNNLYKYNNYNIIYYY